MKERIVYVDNAGTTAMSKTAVDAMLPYMTEFYGNPSTMFSVGRLAKKGLEQARETIANAIGAKPEEIFFTGGGSEADNLALKGIADKYSKKGKHIITSAIEHHAISHTLEFLGKHGWDITTLPVDEYGMISIEMLENAIREDTVLISIMMANNEIGTILPVKEIGAVAKKHGVIFHTDAVQAAGHIPIDVNSMNIDMLSLAGHKFRGPKGVGALYIRKGIGVSSLVHGGGQEKGRRAGTENVAGICAMAAALEEAVKNMDENIKSISAKRDRLISELTKIPYTRLTGHPELRLPGTASFTFEGIEGESLVLSLDDVGICAATGSACSTGSLDPSHVLMAIGLPHAVAHGSLRISINECTTDEDIDYILYHLPPIIERLRSMSPLWADMMKENK